MNQRDLYKVSLKLFKIKSNSMLKHSEHEQDKIIVTVLKKIRDERVYNSLLRTFRKQQAYIKQI